MNLWVGPVGGSVYAPCCVRFSDSAHVQVGPAKDLQRDGSRSREAACIRQEAKLSSVQPGILLHQLVHL